LLHLCVPTRRSLLLQDQAALLDLSDALQRRARQVMEQRNKGRPAVNRELSRLDGADARYR
jgi:histone deacetylase 6